MTLPQNKVIRFLDINGDGTGEKDLGTANGSVTPVVFKLRPPIGEAYALHRMLVHISASPTVSADEYGSLTVLTNGLDLGVYNAADDSLILDLCDGLPVKNNSGWSQRCFDMEPDTFGTGVKFVKARWTFDRAGGPIVISRDEYFGAVVNDNLTALVGHHLQIQGEKT